MPYLRKRDTGATTDLLSADSVEYQTLKAMKFQSDVTAATPPGAGSTPATGGFVTGETGGTIKAGQPVWEEVAQEDVSYSSGRVMVAVVPAAATAADETTGVNVASDALAGTLTDVEYVPNSSVTGVATNNRTIQLQQATVTGTASPVRAVTALAAVTWDATHSNPGGNVPTPLAVLQAAFVATEPSELQVSSVHNGTGLADPGGVLYAVYTPA